MSMKYSSSFENEHKSQLFYIFTEMMIFGAFPLVANILNREMVSSLPTISSKRCGRYFSILKINKLFTIIHISSLRGVEKEENNFIIKLNEFRRKKNGLYKRPAIIYHGKCCFRDVSLGFDDDAPLVLGTTSIGISMSVILQRF